MSQKQQACSLRCRDVTRACWSRYARQAEMKTGAHLLDDNNDFSQSQSYMTAVGNQMVLLRQGQIKALEKTDTSERKSVYIAAQNKRQDGSEE